MSVKSAEIASLDTEEGRVRATSLARVCIILAVVLEVLFYSLSSSSNAIFWGGAAALSILIFASYFVHGHEIRQYVKLFDPYVLVLLGFLVFQFGYTAIVYNQDPVSFLKASYFYFFLLLTYGLLFVFARDGNSSRLFDALLLIVSVTCLLHIVNTYQLNTVGIGFLDIDARTRLGAARVYTLPSLTLLMTAYSFFRIVHVKNARRSLYVAGFLICFLAVMYVRQSRVEIAVLLVAVATMIVFRNRDSRIRTLLILVLFLSLVVAWLLGLFDPILASFAIDGTMGFSTSNRINELSYYWTRFLENPIFGSGLLYGYASAGWYAALHGPNGLFWSSDVGLVGVLGDIGLAAIFFYLIPLIRMAHTLLKAPNTLGSYKPLYIGIFSLASLLMITAIPFTRDTMLAWPFYIALFEHWRASVNDNTDFFDGNNT